MLEYDRMDGPGDHRWVDWGLVRQEIMFWAHDPSRSEAIGPFATHAEAAAIVIEQRRKSDEWQARHHGLTHSNTPGACSCAGKCCTEAYLAPGAISPWADMDDYPLAFRRVCAGA